MSFFTPAEIEALSRTKVRRLSLVRMHCRSETLRYALGTGAFEINGEVWQGFGAVVSIDGLANSRGTEAQRVTFTVSGVDPELLPLVFAEEDEVSGRTITLYWQLLDADEQPVGRLIPAWFGRMERPSIDYTEATAESGSQATITLPAEWILINRSRPANGRYTDADQQRRYPGDRFCDRAPLNKNRTLVWPKF